MPLKCGVCFENVSRVIIVHVCAGRLTRANPTRPVHYLCEPCVQRCYVGNTHAERACPHCGAGSRVVWDGRTVDVDPNGPAFMELRERAHGGWDLLTEQDQPQQQQQGIDVDTPAPDPEVDQQQAPLPGPEVVQPQPLPQPQPQQQQQGIDVDMLAPDPFDQPALMLPVPEVYQQQAPLPGPVVDQPEVYQPPLQPQPRRVPQYNIVQMMHAENQVRRYVHQNMESSRNDMLVSLAALTEAAEASEAIRAQAQMVAGSTVQLRDGLVGMHHQMTLLSAHGPDNLNDVLDSMFQRMTLDEAMEVCRVVHRAFQQ